LEKPDGLQWLAPENMPEAIAQLKLDDLPGISRGMSARVGKAHVWGIHELYALDLRHARMIWRSVEGERFARGLQGEDIPLIKTQRNTYEQSKVLAPKYRLDPMATPVGRWLVEQAPAQFSSSRTQATSISINLMNLVLLSERNGELFLPLAQGKTAGAKRCLPPSTVLICGMARP